jgi:glycoside/pentoside/hexuronide:cation symporter, GPH family
MAEASVEQGPAPSQGRVSLGTRAFLGVGLAAEGTQNVAFNVFVLFYYNNVLGLSGTWTGAALFIALCLDAVMDPLVGSLSDSWRSRLGRRHPFMYASVVPMAISFMLLFAPPAGLSNFALFAWLLAASIGVRVSMTLYQIPSGALIPEITQNYDERTSLASWRSLFGWLGAIFVLQIAYLGYFATTDGSNGLLDASRFPRFGLACAAIATTAILLSTVGTHRLIPSLRSGGGEPFTLARLLGEARNVAANHSYRMLLIAALFASVAGGFSDIVGLHVNTYFWELSAAQIGGLVWGAVVGIVLGVAVTRPLTERLDKKRAALLLAVFGVTIGPAPIFLRLLGWFPANGAPALLPILFVHLTVLVTAAVSIGIVVASMLADVVDENELETGKAQEGMFMAAVTFAVKAASGLGGLFAGMALDIIDFPRGADAGPVTPDKVRALGLAVGPGLMAFYFLTLFFMTRYRITRERHHEVRAALEERRRNGDGVN